MKKSLFFVAIASVLMLASCGKEKDTVVALDLSQANPALEFDETGLWKGTYDLEAKALTSQVFTFQHTAGLSEYGGVSYPYYSGFTASNNATGEAANYENASAKGAMAGAGKPYAVCYWGDYEYDGVVYRSSDIIFEQVSSPKHVYINNTAWVVNSLKNGDNFARAFKDGDYFKLTIKAVDEAGKEIKGQEVEYYLADFRNGKTFINNSWEKVDLSALGQCKGITFAMETTDVVSYDGGTTYYANTPTYFALDGLTISVPAAEKK